MCDAVKEGRKPLSMRGFGCSIENGLLESNRVVVVTVLQTRDVSFFVFCVLFFVLQEKKRTREEGLLPLRNNAKITATWGCPYFLSTRRLLA